MPSIRPEQDPQPTPPHAAGTVTLALDTTTRAGSVAVCRNGVLLAERTGAPEVPHGIRLPADVITLLETAGVDLETVTLFAVATGPGAFTGMRIGIATMQGLSFAQRVPIVGISALDALAHALQPQAAGIGASLVASWMDAARGEVFTALHRCAPDGSLSSIEAAAVGSADGTLDRWAPQLEGVRVLFGGDGAQRYGDRIVRALGSRTLVVAHLPLAGVIAALAESAAALGRATPPDAIRPLYVRRPDAELARERLRLDPVEPSA